MALTKNEIITSVNDENLPLFVDTVARVHGPKHPWLSDVKSTWESVYSNFQNDAEPETIKSELAQLRELSLDYNTPSDGCESYAAMDKGLEKFEKDVLEYLD